MADADQSATQAQEPAKDESSLAPLGKLYGAQRIIFQNARSPYQRVWPSFLTRQLDFVVKCLCL